MKGRKEVRKRGERKAKHKGNMRKEDELGVHEIDINKRRMKKEM